jgi:hypothetical protein
MGQRGPVRDLDRVQAVVGMRSRGMTYRDIGTALGITRQRAQQIGRPDDDLRRRVVASSLGCCERCGCMVGLSGQLHHRVARGANPDVYNTTDNLALLCVSCHRVVHGGAMSDALTAAFLTRLWELQDAADINNSELARQVGVSPSYITRLKDGTRGRQLSLRVALRMVEKFPDLAIFLSTDSPTIKIPETEGAEGSETAGEGQQ